MEDLLMAAIGDEDNREIYSEFIDIVMNQAAPALLASVSVLNNLTYLSDYYELDYADVQLMAGQLAMQLRSLEARGCTLLFWQSADILVVDKQFYLIANLAQLVPLHKKNPEMLVLNYPPISSLSGDSCAPELLKIDALPFITHCSASYYSLALLCLKKLNLSLDEIQGTKLFYFLERCLKENANERHCFWL